MQFSEQWLRTWCSPNITTEELAHVLTMSGLEVEEVNPAAKNFNSIIIAQVLEAEPHPNADKLKICKVNTGSEILQIVCGAKNVTAGIKVPCALIGAKIPLDNGEILHIKLGKLRGIESFGMLCSAHELGLESTSNTDGLMILPDDAPTGKDIREYLNLNDNIFTIKLTPNRADCLSIQGIARELSAITNTTLHNIQDKINSSQKPSFISKFGISIDENANNLCGKFLAREIINIQVGERVTPDYMLQRLKRSGLRSVNVIVDISNYVMLELGQPNHMFDADIVSKNIKVRWSKPDIDKNLHLINDNICDIYADTGIVADENGAQALAGIMGGKKTSITDKTKNILIECAFWFPQAIAGKTKQYKLNSDAAYRYERGVDPNLAHIAIVRITQLVLEICATEQTQISEIIQANQINISNDLAKPKTIEVAYSQIQKISGQNIEMPHIMDILKRLNLQPSFNSDEYSISEMKCKYTKDLEVNRGERQNCDEGSTNSTARNNFKDNEYSVSKLKCIIPSYRFDLNIPEDIIEEVIRLYGFDNIKLRPPKANLEFLAYPTNKYSLKNMRHALAQHGYNEIISFGFTSVLLEEQFSNSPSQIKLKNPLAEQYQVMRSTLLGGLIEKLIYNQHQHKPASIRLFESGIVFNIDSKIYSSLKSVKNIAEYQYISGIANGLTKPQQWGNSKQNIDFYDVKGDIENILLALGINNLEFKPAQHIAFHQGRCANIFSHGVEIGIIGELHPKLQQHYDILGNTIGFEINFSKLDIKPKLELKEVNKNPAVKRDIAVVVDNDTPAQILIQSLAKLTAHKNWFENIDIFNIEVFDVFKPKDDLNNSIKSNQKSIALHFFIQKQNGTLTDEELAIIMKLAIENLQQYGEIRK